MASNDQHERTVSTAELAPSDALAASPASPATAEASPSVTVVCCVEHGALESETVLLAGSLRRFGGSLASCPVLAIRPRLGPPLAPQTRAAFEELGVKFVSAAACGPYKWYAFCNKVRCLEVAEEMAETEQILWLDSDILVLSDPRALLLSDEEEICAVPGSAHGGTTGPDDPDEGLWWAMCEALGMELEKLPWLVAPVDGERVRFYLNSGVFTVQRGGGFARLFRRCVTDVMDARITSGRWRLNLLEQAAFGLAILRGGLQYRLAPYIYNVHVGPGLEPFYDADAVREAVLLHYHKSLQPSYWSTFMKFLEKDRPEVHQWCGGAGPVSFKRGFSDPRAAAASCLRLGWRMQRLWHERLRCRVPTAPQAVAAGS